MPAALERKLKAKVAGKKMSKDRKDAYVYGTMRRTGWKPSQEKKMNSSQKLIRLAQIDQDLESIIQFDYDDDDKDKKSILPAAAYGATAVGTGAAGLYGIGKMASVAAGGQGLSARGAVRDLGYNVGHLAGGGAGNLGRNIKQGAGVVGGAIKRIAGKAWNAAKGIFMESKEKPIEFDATILGPWHGKTGHTSKIDQLEFPEGLSPAAALKFPFPKLMRYLNQRNLQQQQFHMKIEKLIELNSNLDYIIRFQLAEEAGQAGESVLSRFKAIADKIKSRASGSESAGQKVLEAAKNRPLSTSPYHDPRGYGKYQ